VAVSDLEALVKQQPGDLVAVTRLGEAYEKESQFAKAAAAFEQALKINPRLASPALKLAQLYGGPLQNREKALEFAKKARELAPADAKVAGIIGALAYQSGNFTWSFSLLQEASRQLPDDAEVQQHYAWAAYSLGKLKEARGSMKRALEISPGGPVADDANAFLALVTDDETPKGSLSDAAWKRLQADPSYVPALMVQASGLSGSGDSKPAEAIYLRVLERYPDFAPAQKALARIYADDPTRTGQAYDLAMKARKILSDDPELAGTLGQLGYMRKEYARAIQLFQESERKRPLDANGSFYLGMSYVQAKQKAKAQETLERALAAGLKEPSAAEAKQTLAELEK
jgi:tetratricopeptide (TPR) repeat protein